MTDSSKPPVAIGTLVASLVPESVVNSSTSCDAESAATSSAQTLTLHRFEEKWAARLPTVKNGLLGIVVDVETTGLDTERDAVIELSLVPFIFHATTGDVIEYGHAFSWLSDAGVPISDEIARITGITNEMVKGESIDVGLVSKLIAGAELVISHNAKFDRPFCERVVPLFAELRWACSYEDVKWRDHYASSNLEFLAFKHLGVFFDAHRAEVDSYATVELLGERFADGTLPMKQVLDRVRGRWWRVYANGPFHFNYKLKARGYKWSSGDDGRPKGWWTDVRDGDGLTAEERWLSDETSENRPMLRAINARNRFTVRI